MSQNKETILSITPDGKESIHDRIKYLFRGRSMRKAASDWGLAYSTLNNYFVRSGSPSIEVLITISLIEGVSLEWLATGKDPDNHAERRNPLNPNESNSNSNALITTWLTLLESLTQEEIKALLTLVMRQGVNGLLEIAERKTSLDSQFLHLDLEEKERLWVLHNAKKGAPEESEVSRANNPQDKQQAC